MAPCPFGLKAAGARPEERDADLVAGGPGSARAGRRWA